MRGEYKDYGFNFKIWKKVLVEQKRLLPLPPRKRMKRPKEVDLRED